MTSTRSQSRASNPELPRPLPVKARTRDREGKENQAAARTPYSFFPESFFPESREAGPTRRQSAKICFNQSTRRLNRKRFDNRCWRNARCASPQRATGRRCASVEVDCARSGAISARAIPARASADHTSRRSAAAPTRADRAARSSRTDRKSTALAQFQRKALPPPRDCPRAWPRPGLPALGEKVDRLRAAG